MPRRGAIELEYLRRGFRILGVDEVGRGCLAGPVYAACAQIDYERLRRLPSKSKSLIRDSKALTHEQRQMALKSIGKIAIEFHVGVASVKDIEELGIVGATFLAMHRAIEQCAQPTDILLIDGKAKLRGYSGEQVAIVGGDDLCYAIAAASIVAKEARDEYMREVAKDFPHYGFQRHVGYGTRSHLQALDTHGPCPLHRSNFEPIRNRISSREAH